MPKVTKILGNNKARAWESLGFAHKKRLCQHFDTTSFLFRVFFSYFSYQGYLITLYVLLPIRTIYIPLSVIGNR